HLRKAFRGCRPASASRTFSRSVLAYGGAWVGTTLIAKRNLCLRPRLSSLNQSQQLRKIRSFKVHRWQGILRVKVHKGSPWPLFSPPANTCTKPEIVGVHEFFSQIFLLGRRKSKLRNEYSGR